MDYNIIVIQKEALMIDAFTEYAHWSMGILKLSLILNE